MELGNAEAQGLVERFDARAGYLKRLREFVDLDAIHEARLTVLVDSMYGSAQGYIAEALGEGATHVPRRPRDPPARAQVRARRERRARGRPAGLAEDPDLRAGARDRGQAPQPLRGLKGGLRCVGGGARPATGAVEQVGPRSLRGSRTSISIPNTWRSSTVSDRTASGATAWWPYGRT